jgi:hypothetical protein
MTPYEKAKDLIAKYQNICYDFDKAKQSAALAVFEIIDDLTDAEQDSAYWQEVRYEIYATTDPWINTEARADRFNEDL